ncbi:MAG: DUF2961 domain-containing protein [Chloroflexota bacterium]|nr:DUF2961 domain-containing protein [Chloroflexota bacterium]
MDYFNGLHLNMGNISRLSKAKTRSISAENFKGEKGKGGMATDGFSLSAAQDLGQGWKVSPCIQLEANSVTTLAEIEGPGAIQHIWITTYAKYWRSLILRFYWDDEETPSIEVPFGDFFCNGWTEYCHVNSMPISANSHSAFNSYWEMPFRKSARVTIENLLDKPVQPMFYQFDYTLTDVPADVGYLHAQWRRSNPLPYKEVYTILDGVQGMGHYVGAYMAWGSNNRGWWGEGEIKFYMDGDSDFPTICGTGTEDYFGGAWCFGNQDGEYSTYSTPYLGLPQVIKPDGFRHSQQRFGMYRWHIPDPIRFEQDLRVTIQALGWRSGTLHEAPFEEYRYLPLQDDIASTAFWYQAEPHAPFPELPDRDYLEVI